MKILIVEDEPKIAEQLAAAFADGDYEIKKADTLSGAETLLRSFWPDFVVLDANFPSDVPDGDPEFNADGLLRLLAKRAHIPPHVILISGANVSVQHFDDISDWLRTERIADVLPKSGAWKFMQALLRHRVELLRRQRFRFQSEDFQKDQDWLFQNRIASVEPAMMKIARQIRDLVHRGSNEWTVLITGPNGSGKGVVAKAIHRETEIKLGCHVPFIVCRCGAIPETLAEAELFGSVRSAFFQAKDREGLLEQAGDGILFLDDIHLLPPKIQGTLLDALQNRQFRRLGDNKERSLTARVVAATNADLEDLLARQQMSEEFYNRVARLRITVPSLAQRSLDIEPLMNHLSRVGNIGNPCEFDADVVKAFQGYR